MLDSFGKNSNRMADDFASSVSPRPKILVLFGTRPEAIKLAPVIYELKKNDFPIIVVSSSQHTDLLQPFLDVFQIKPDYDLQVMTANQTPNDVAAKILSALDEILEREKPEMIFVQGDTTTALAGAFAAFNRKIKIAHVEAGLRSGNIDSPFPEEANRRLISQLATVHFCATSGNRKNLLAENVGEEKIFVSGNTVVDALFFILENSKPSERIKNLINETGDSKRIVLTTHRRESFGAWMAENLKTLRDFVANHNDVCLIFPVHPNPNVQSVTNEILADRERIFLLEPLDYADFVSLMKAARLIVSDSGGVQEEAPSLGVPLIVLRENTERPEAIESGVARLVGDDSLAQMLEENFADESWLDSVGKIENPFGDGKAARRIVEVLENELRANAPEKKEIIRKTSGN